MRTKIRLVAASLAAVLILSSCVVPLIGMLASPNPITAVITQVFLNSVTEAAKGVLVREGKALYTKLPEDVRKYTDPILEIRRQYLALEKQVEDLKLDPAFLEKQNLLSSLEAKQSELVEGKNQNVLDEVFALRSEIQAQNDKIAALEKKRVDLLQEEKLRKEALAREKEKNEALREQLNSTKAEVLTEMNSQKDILKSPVEFTFDEPNVADSIPDIESISNVDPETYERPYINEIISSQENIEKTDWESVFRASAVSTEKVREEWNPENKIFKAAISDNLLIDMPLMSENKQLADNFDNELRSKIINEANTYKISVIKRN